MKGQRYLVATLQWNYKLKKETCFKREACKLGEICSRVKAEKNKRIFNTPEQKLFGMQLLHNHIILAYSCRSHVEKFQNRMENSTERLKIKP